LMWYNGDINYINVLLVPLLSSLMGEKLIECAIC
jgi:hypothetical protein